MGKGRLSPRLKEMVAYWGQRECYEEASEFFQNTLGLQISDTTIFRVTNEMGDRSKEWLEDRPVEQGSQEEIVYAQVDGSMLLTREEGGWKEAKVGRVFKGEDQLKLSD